MAELVTNVHVAGGWYGPAHGNADRVGAEVAERVTNPAAWGTKEADGDGLDDLTVAELRDLAAEKDIDLGGADRKADIVTAIRSAR